VLISRLKRDGKAVGLNVDEVALECVSGVLMGDGLDVVHTEASPVWQQAATLEPQACWMGTATVYMVSLAPGHIETKGERTDRNAEAVQADEVLAAVAAGDLLSVAADGLVGVGVDIDVGVLVGCTARRSGVGNNSHGGDEERLEEGHFEGVGLV
jgi:hypothetical protein